MKHEPAQPQEAKPRRRVPVRVLIGAGLLVAGAAAAAATFLVPDQTEDAVGAVYGQVRAGVQQLETAIDPDRVPIVKLGDPGGQAELDACDGYFVHMVAYQEQAPALQPTYSAHNGCGGDVLLPWELGQKVDVVSLDGTTTRYAVVDERDTPQWTTTAADIAGMGGELLLQTCYWDDDTMRFVALARI